MLLERYMYPSFGLGSEPLLSSICLVVLVLCNFLAPLSMHVKMDIVFMMSSISFKLLRYKFEANQSLIIRKY